MNLIEPQPEATTTSKVRPDRGSGLDPVTLKVAKSGRFHVGGQEGYLPTSRK